MNRLALCLILALVAACSPLSKLEKITATPDGSFGSSLALEYRDYAESEQKLGHGKVSRYFANKGLRAAKGENVMPENPDDWRVANDPLPEDVMTAYQNLMQLRTEFVEKVNSTDLARAQLLYDCWLMQAHTHASEEDTAPCRDELKSMLPVLKADAVPPEPKTHEEFPARFTILFAAGSTALDSNARYAISQTLEAFQECGEHCRIRLTGYADQLGSAKMNLALSQKRALTVSAALVQSGVPSDALSLNAKGKSNPVEPTLDGFANDRNRRVEIVVSRRKK